MPMSFEIDQAANWLLVHFPYCMLIIIASFSCCIILLFRAMAGSQYAYEFPYLRNITKKEHVCRQNEVSKLHGYAVYIL
jgi:hypothetical protein